MALDTFAPNTKQIKRDGNGLTGRLIAFPSSTNSFASNDLLLSKAFTIEFPAMPDSIEFARRAEYIVHTSQGLPDGVHAYKKTQPLKIPFSFSLHHNDRGYCPQGSLTILQIAARLHSFVLPINANSKDVEAHTKQNYDYKNGDDASTKDKAQGPFTISIDTVQSNNIYSPLTARLELIFVGSEDVGVSCNGYVEEVNVKLKGPFMRGPNNSFNLPTAADYSFVFVHHPGHGNARDFLSGLSAQTDAYAKDVRDRFFNTASMVALANYQGFEPPVAPKALETDTGTPSAKEADAKAASSFYFPPYGNDPAPIPNFTQPRWNRTPTTATSPFELQPQQKK